jgi:co-chaperonin GroES (HSP10)
MLESRILHRTADQREFVKAEWTGANTSGIQPLDDKCLVRMDDHAEVTSGGIVIPDDTRARQSMASETGVLVALGEAAFLYADDGVRVWVTRKPVPGDRVVVERYAGRTVQGVDGVEYRLCSQRAIGGVFLPPE